MPVSPSLTVCDDRASLFHSVAEEMCSVAKRAIDAHGSFYLALAGGSTPAELYRLLADSYHDRITWSRAHLWFGDERCVPHDHPQSNYRMVRETLLAGVEIPPSQIHPIPTGGSPQSCADDYHHQLLGYSADAASPPVFDLVLLGIGNDGHTASLFPGTPILEERQHYAAAVYVERLKSWRISLTYPLLNAAKACWIVAAGKEKAAIVQRAMSPAEGEPLPIQRLNPNGGVHYYIDRAAASEWKDE